MEREYTIQEFFNIFIKKIWLIILLSIIGLFAGLGIARFLITPQYSSSISMYIKNSSDYPASSINSSDLTASQQLVNTYIVILQDDYVMKQLVVSLNKDYSIQELQQLFGIEDDTFNNTDDTINILEESDNKEDYRGIIAKLAKCIDNSLTMSPFNNTEVLNITATTPSAQLSADICNHLTTVAPGILIRVTKAGSVQTIGVAEPSLSPVSPNIMRDTAIGFTIGFILSLLIIFLTDFFDTTLKSTTTLSKNFGLVNLGQVASISSSKDKGNSKNNIIKNYTVLDKDIPFYFIESFKLIRTNLMFTMATKNNNIVAVSSSGVGEGKSVTSANTAISLAQTGKKVLLIDCDLRKPVQHKIFSLKNKIGISQYLGKMANLEDITQHNVLENLDVITSGFIPPNPSEMIASDNMKDFLSEISKLYDYVIIDTPPINVVSDVIGISKSISGLIFVARYQQTKYNDISRAMEVFKVANMNVLGFVLNGDENIYNKYSKYNNRYKSYEYRQNPENDNN